MEKKGVSRKVGRGITVADCVYARGCGRIDRVGGIIPDILFVKKHLHLLVDYETVS